MATKEELFKHADKLDDEKKYDDVIALLTDEELEKHESFKLYNLRGMSWDEKGDYDKAIADYTKAIELSPKEAIVYSNRGVTWEKIGDYDKALIDYNKAIEEKSDFAKAYNNRGVIWAKKNNHKEAINDYSKAIELNPKYVSPYNNRANSWRNLKEYDKAISDCNKAIELDPEYAFAYNNRGIVWVAKKEYDKSISDYLAAIKLNPSYANPYSNLAFLYDYSLNDYYKAIEYYNKAIELDLYDTDLKLSRDIAIEKLKEQVEVKKLAPFGEEIKKQFAIIHAEVKVILDFAATDGSHPLVHYTKLFVAEALLKEKDTKLRYYNALYMNDPSEGEILFDCFSAKKRELIKKSFDEGKSASEISVYLGSFLSNSKNEPHEDELVMWRTYGKDENKVEAAGCSLVIAPEFFEKEDGDTGKISLIDMKHALYKVIYANRGKLTKKDTGIKSSIHAIEKAIIELEKIKAKNKGENKEVTPVVNRRIFESISKICHLFKSADYAFEHEVRVVKYVPLDSEVIQRDESTPKKLYINSANSIVPHIKKIFVGTKVTNPSHWKAYLDNLAKERKRKDGISCSIEFQQSSQKFQ